MPKKARAVITAGSKLAKAAASRTLKSGSPKIKAQDVLDDPDAEPQGGARGNTRPSH